MSDLFLVFPDGPFVVVDLLTGEPPFHRRKKVCHVPTAVPPLGLEIPGSGVAEEWGRVHSGNSKGSLASLDIPLLFSFRHDSGKEVWGLFCFVLI